MTHVPSEGQRSTPGGLSLDWSSSPEPRPASTNPHWRSQTTSDYVALGAVVYQSIKRAVVDTSVTGAPTLAELTWADSCLEALNAQELRDLLRGFTWAVRTDLERVQG